jgi:hypothetical protein
MIVPHRVLIGRTASPCHIRARTDARQRSPAGPDGQTTSGLTWATAARGRARNDLVMNRSSGDRHSSDEGISRRPSFWVKSSKSFTLSVASGKLATRQQAAIQVSLTGRLRPRRSDSTLSWPHFHATRSS